MKRLENHLENFLLSFRYVVFLVVAVLMVSSFVAFYLGAKSSFEAFAHAFAGEESSVVILYLVSSLDEFLLGIIMIIISLGLYELFISKLDVLEEETMPFLNWLKFTSLEDLKAVLTKVIIIILMVYFFKTVIVMKFDSPLSILYLAIGTQLLSFPY